MIYYIAVIAVIELIVIVILSFRSHYQRKHIEKLQEERRDQDTVMMFALRD